MGGNSGGLQPLRRSVVRQYPRGGGVGLHLGGGGWAAEGWGQKSGGGVNSGGVQHKYKSPKQFELKQNLKALRALNTRWALPFYPIFEDEKSKALDEKSVKRKIA